MIKYLLENINDEFIFSKENLKYLNKYDLYYLNYNFYNLNNFNNQYSLKIYEEFFFGSKISCGIYIGGGDCKNDTLNITKLKNNIKKCLKCQSYYCISCFNYSCIFCSLLNLDSLNLFHISSDNIVFKLLLNN